ncbi:MAG TPA: hypothetical protein DEF34_00055 [Desulfotomaculum sp.]|nr:MAG: hypothetical protein VR67_05630 [Peptococcaceae bacterium BRH_c8a]KJS79164.1 MAG: hypothetical protein JL56_00250 [Desulfotomaculum sp. BICA1-6]HBX22017.1 hypothetical protein [Desulfotomaculum sp.]
MASPRLKDNCQELSLIFSRLLAFVSVLLIVGFATWMIAVVAGAPWGFAGAIGGATAGVVGFFMLLCGKFFDVRTFTCPNCGHSDRTLQDIGYYNCFNCNTEYHIAEKEVYKLSA